MKPPKVIFKLPSASQEAKIFQLFCCYALKEFDWSHIIYEVHPKLEKIVKGSTNQKEIYKELCAYSKNYILENKELLENLKNGYQKEWDNINDEYLKVLSEDFDVSFPRDRRVIMAYVSMVPRYPRFLDSWSFNVGLKSQYMKLIAAHEILHFMYFKKWKEVFSKVKKVEFSGPHLVWKLSEILTPIMLNNNPEIQKLIKVKDYSYPEFRNIKIGREKLITRFEKMYKNHLKTKSPFALFLKSAWEEAEKYKNGGIL